MWALFPVKAAGIVGARPPQNAQPGRVRGATAAGDSALDGVERDASLGLQVVRTEGSRRIRRVF